MVTIYKIGVVLINKKLKRRVPTECRLIYNKDGLLLKDKNYAKGHLKSKFEYLYKTPQYS